MPYATVKKFESEVAKYAGAKYGVAVSSGTNALFLCFLKARQKGVTEITLPARTYVGVACAAKNAGLDIKFDDEKWAGAYQIFPTMIVDSALRFYRDMYINLFDDSYYCLSFHSHKHLPIGRGGMILTNDEETVEWFKRMRFDGRAECSQQDDKFTMLGWNMYMTPEQAARGLTLLSFMPDENDDIDDYDTYPDLSKYEVFKNEAVF